MKIRDVELFVFGGEAGPTSDAYGSSEQISPSLLVRLRTADGREGWGEASIEARLAHTSARREALAAVLVGRSVFDIEELHTLEALQPPPLRAATEIAVWDLLGRVLHQPLCNLLGGYYRHRIPVSVRLAGHHVETTVRLARELAEQGFHTQTILSSPQPEEDLAKIKALRELIGERVTLRYDGQGRFAHETVMDLCAGLELEALQFLLDPLNVPELHSLASLGRRTNVVLGLCRNIRSPADVLRAVRCGAGQYAAIDLDRVGGISPARACAIVAAAGEMWPLLFVRAGLGVALAAMLHLAAAMAAFRTAHEVAVLQPLNGILQRPLEISDGMITVPQGHGLGVEVERSKLERP